MNTTQWVGLTALMSLAALTSVAGCASEAKPTSASGPTPTGTENASARASSPKESIANAALVIDVRTEEEFASGHLARAENIPVDQVESRVDAIASKLNGDKTKPIAVYCASGGRAGRAKGMLEKAGFTHVTNAGGYTDLKE